MLLFLPTYVLCYAAVPINFTYYAQYYAHVKEFCYKTELFYKSSYIQCTLPAWHAHFYTYTTGKRPFLQNEWL